jgi:hypothetical protein
VSGGGKNTDSVTGAVLDYFAITGTGAHKGCIENNGNPAEVVRPGVSIKARVRIRKSTSATGTFHVYFVTATGDANDAAPKGSLSIDLSTVSSTGWRVLGGEVLSAANNTMTPDWRLRISGGAGAGTLGGTVIGNTHKVYIDYIELYVDGEDQNPSLVRWSRPEDVESYDALTGFQFVGPNDGQKITSAFPLRGNLYYVKERALYSTYDSGAAEPAFWPVETVSTSVGSPSSKGVALGDGWAVIAARSGLYIFAGGAPVKISHNIQPTWDLIDWAYGYQIWTEVDVEKQLVYVGVPINPDTSSPGLAHPTYIIVCDYSGKTLPDADCDFTVWTTQSRCASFMEISTGERLLMQGRGTQNKVGYFDETTTAEFGTTARDVHYRTGFLETGPERELAGFLTCFAYGDADMTPTLYGPASDDAGATVQPEVLGTVTLEDFPENEIEWTSSFRGDRVAVELATDADEFAVDTLTLWMKAKPGDPKRGAR